MDANIVGGNSTTEQNIWKIKARPNAKVTYNFCLYENLKSDTLGKYTR